MTTSSIDGVTSLRRAIAGVLQVIDQDPIGALRQARAAVRTWPDTPAAYRVLAFALRKANREGEADQVDLEGIALSEQQPGPIAALKAWGEGRWEDAEVLIRDHLKRDPEDASAAKMLADIAVRFGAIREAEIFYKRSLIFSPGYHDARLTLAMLFSRTGRTSEALAATEEVLDRDADNVAALSFKAGLLSQGRRLDAADKIFRKLVARHPHNSLAWHNYAYLLKTVGRIDESIAAYRRAIAIDDGNGLAWFGLANLKTARLTAPDIEAMREALSRATNDELKVHLHFALGKAFNDNREYEAAFEQYAIGSTLRRARSPHDAEAVSADVRKAERVFSPALMASRSGASASDPIFIISMPRSGSTLVEQILASHPLIEGTEELYEIEGIARSIGHGNSKTGYLDQIANLPADRLTTLGDEYIEKTRRYRTTSRPYFTDKMPGNWWYAGLIHKILPNAKIVDVRRHPLSCGQANFAQHYNWGNNFSYDLNHMGRYYSDYVRQIAHFDRVMPGRIHRVIYERLIEDLDGEVSRLLNYLELPFDESCLRFYENKRPVHTPSSQQVRRPINRDGMSTWRNYEPWLGPLKEALGPVLTLYPDVPSRWPD